MTDRHADSGVAQLAADSPLGSVLADRRSPDDASHVPALETLCHQQDDVRQRLSEGFDSVYDVFLWLHAAASVAVGDLPDDWAVSVIGDRFWTAALLTDSERRERLTTHPPTGDVAASVRGELRDKYLDPAFQRARTRLRQQSNDHDDAVEDLDRQKYLALRPRVHQVAVRQHRVLRDAMGIGPHAPLNSRTGVRDWISRVGLACGGRTGGWADAVRAPNSEWWKLLNGEAGMYLLVRLADELLPPMNRMLRQVSVEGTEQVDRERTDRQVMPG